MYENMLVCLDGSSLAEQILPYAEAQARCFHAKITIIQVAISPIPKIVAGGSTYKEIQEIEKKSQMLVQTATEYLNRVADTMKKKGMEVAVAVVEAPSAGEGIINYARGNNIDLIAISSHGRSGLRKILLGSVAEHVFKAAALPVLMFKPNKH